jgi:hypothetical protein
MGRVLFGLPIFKANNLVKTRLVYEYDGAVQMGIEYDEKKNRFLVDHLVPLRTIWDGQTLLGPDETVDAYIKRGNYWVLKENIRAFNRYNNERTRQIKPPVPRVWFRP